MPIGSKKISGLAELKKLDRTTLLAIAAAVLGLLLCGFLYRNLNTRRAAVATLKTDVESREAIGNSVQLPTPQEIETWAKRETQARNVLLNEDAVPEVYEEITRLITQNRLQRYTVDTVEQAVSAEENPLDNSLRALGIQRYLAITVKFRADYRDAATFIGAVAALPRSLAIRSMELKRDVPMVEGTLVIALYKRGAA